MFQVFAAMCLGCSICGFIMKPLPKRPASAEEDNMGCMKKIAYGSCNPRLLVNVPFMLLALSNLFATQGLYIPYMFIQSYAEEQGVTSVNAAFLISIIGITNTLARILTGLVTDLPFVNPLIVTTLALGRSSGFVGNFSLVFQSTICASWKGVGVPVNMHAQ